MADGNTVFPAACFRDQLSEEELEKIKGLLASPGLSKEQCDDLNHFVSDVQSDLSIANDLVDLVDTVVGSLNVFDGAATRERAQACSAILGVQLQLQAITRRLQAISDKLRAAS